MFLNITISPVTLETVNSLFDVILKVLAVIIVVYIITIHREVKRLYAEIIELEESKFNFTVSNKAQTNLFLKSNPSVLYSGSEEQDTELQKEKMTIIEDTDAKIRALKLSIESKLFLLRLYK